MAAVRNGLQAGVQLRPPGGEYAKGQKIDLRFSIRNTGDHTLDVLLPNLMTHAFYDKIHVTTPDGREISLRQDTGLGGPVGWRRLRMEPDTMQQVSGLPILISDASLEEGVEAVICAEPGQTCCIGFALPKFVDPDGELLKSGELRFLVTDTAVTCESEDAHEADTIR